MSEELSYEELQQSVKEMQTYIASLKKAMDEKDEQKDDDHEAAWKKAMEEHKDDDEKHEAVKLAFKRAMEEEDDDKKKEAQLEAMSMRGKHKRAMDDEDDKDDHEASGRIASLENEIKSPLIQKILTANQTVNPAGIRQLEKSLKTASLAQVKQKWAELEPFANAIGMTPLTAPSQQQGIPFMAGQVMESNDKLHIASSDEEFAKLDSEKLMQEMYQ